MEGQKSENALSISHAILLDRRISGIQKFFSFD